MISGSSRRPSPSKTNMEMILAEQRREITESKALKSDLDFAFNLQMQEAMTASLALYNPNSLPSSSSSSSSSQPPPPPPPEVEDFDYMALLLDDMERLDQEQKDFEESECLMREMRQDLDRRMHDQNVAREIMNIPDTEWDKNGDNYERPYEEEERKLLLPESNGVRVKVYCKGVESESRIRDMKVMVGGVGVAICDCKDNLLFQVSKGVDVGAGEEGKCSVGGILVQLESLIEGLTAAFGLDLKRVSFFLDDSMVYRYVTGKVQLKHSQISTLVHQVSLLQEKFADCKLSLVASSDIKFAYQFARDAIASQIAWPAENSKGKRKLKETCVICYEDTDVDQIFSVDGCLHRYCFSCMRQHVEVKLLNGMIAKCPYEDCESEVSIETCGKILDPKLFDILCQRKREASIAIVEKVYCPYPRCSALMSKNEVLEYTNASFVGGEKSGARKCVKCHLFFCINCRVPWHYNMTCDNYKRSKPHTCTEDVMLDALAKRKLWRQCAKCSHMVELAEGCYHISCRCGYEFCYTCGAEWKDKKPTCRCPIWDERNIIRDGRRR